MADEAAAEKMIWSSCQGMSWDQGCPALARLGALRVRAFQCRARLIQASVAGVNQLACKHFRLCWMPALAHLSARQRVRPAALGRHPPLLLCARRRLPGRVRFLSFLGLFFL